ncbi:hypothetical protein N8005_04910 [Litorivicinus sp.]|nr:hypothetical protein [Litorivicinus sp.]MDC1240395.1 hypothetical protein [Litorivicinus sp.]
MSRQIGIAIVLSCFLFIILLEWWGGNSPNPYAAPDPMAWGSESGASGAICSFAPVSSQ